VTEPDNSRWYVVQTRPHSEAKAGSHLQRQGYGIYMPRYLKRRKHARRVDTVIAPYFPRYLFVAIDSDNQGWRAIDSTVGVLNLVRHGDAPATVPPTVIAALRSREDERGFIQIAAPPRFVPGDKVQIVDGAFSECQGLFEAETDNDRVAILLDLLGRKVRVMLDGGSVAAA
jgi:transcriptional antiterminator RfaH